jgi:GntR family transcriptional regulator/MocR family aminotransferase
MPLRVLENFPMMSLDRDAGTPIYRQIYEQFREEILSGRMPPRTQLPGTRELAAELGVSRHTALNAFELLLAEGYVAGKIGSGTYVAELPEGLVSRHAAAEAGTARVTVAEAREVQAVSLFMPRPDEIGPFRTGMPALDQFPIQTWSRLAASCLRTASVRDLHYSDPSGHLALRKLLADYLSQHRAVRCEPEQILIVAGSQQALSLVARVLLDRGDRLWIEDPNYPGARYGLAVTGARLMSVPVDQEGIDVAAGIERHGKAKAVYVTPSHQFPLGVTMSLRRRLQLLDWAAQCESWIIEDDYDSEYRYNSPPLSSLHGLDTHRRVIYIGTFSKVLMPALRLGYLVAPPELVPAFRAARQADDFCPSFLPQAILAEFIRRGHFARHIRKMRRIYRARLDALVEALHREFGDFLELPKTVAGLNLVAWLPSGVRDSTAAKAALEAGISTTPMSRFYLTEKPRNGLFLGFGGVTPQQIGEGARRLKAALLGIQ